MNLAIEYSIVDVLRRLYIYSEKIIESDQIEDQRSNEESTNGFHRFLLNIEFTLEETLILLTLNPMGCVVQCTVYLIFDKSFLHRTRTHINSITRQSDKIMSEQMFLPSKTV